MNDVDDAEFVAAQVCTVPGVAALHGGRFGEIATYLPGRRLLGVRITDTGCEVHVVVAYPHNVVDVAAAVHRTVGPLVGVPVTVTVADVADDTASATTEGTSR
ncbi:hypothetical protein ACFWPA_16750 [Rhodococcus sp. NPDC058505]|uniref:hypothetical protein n=1 Tax=unclassified Rhodococcus (in: high G+C Gram-positive bacteria) TaxID=192944 RepID=UPI00364FD551